MTWRSKSTGRSAAWMPIIYSDGTVSGSYNFASYYDFVTSDDELKNDAELITLVEKFYNYTVSAEAYRASVSK